VFQLVLTTELMVTAIRWHFTILRAVAVVTQKLNHEHFQCLWVCKQFSSNLPLGPHLKADLQTDWFLVENGDQLMQNSYYHNCR